MIAESMSRNSPIAPGQGGLQVGAELVGHRDPGVHQVLAGPHRHPQGDGRFAVAGQRPQPGPVGAQHIGQHVGVERVVLVAGRSVPAAQVLQLVRGDHDHRRARPRAAHRPPARRAVRSPPRRHPPGAAVRPAGAAPAGVRDA